MARVIITGEEGFRPHVAQVNNYTHTNPHRGLLEDLGAADALVKSPAVNLGVAALGNGWAALNQAGMSYRPEPPTYQDQNNPSMLSDAASARQYDVPQESRIGRSTAGEKVTPDVGQLAYAAAIRAHDQQLQKIYAKLHYSQTEDPEQVMELTRQASALEEQKQRLVASGLHNDQHLATKAAVENNANQIHARNMLDENARIAQEGYREDRRILPAATGVTETVRPEARAWAQGVVNQREQDAMAQERKRLEETRDRVMEMQAKGRKLKPSYANLLDKVNQRLSALGEHAAASVPVTPNQPGGGAYVAPAGSTWDNGEGSASDWTRGQPEVQTPAAKSAPVGGPPSPEKRHSVADLYALAASANTPALRAELGEHINNADIPIRGLSDLLTGAHREELSQKLMTLATRHPEKASAEDEASKRALRAAQANKLWTEASNYARTLEIKGQMAEANQVRAQAYTRAVTLDETFRPQEVKARLMNAGAASANASTNRKELTRKQEQDNYLARHPELRPNANTEHPDLRAARGEVEKFDSKLEAVRAEANVDLGTKPDADEDPRGHAIWQASARKKSKAQGELKAMESRNKDMGDIGKKRAKLSKADTRLETQRDQPEPESDGSVPHPGTPIQERPKEAPKGVMFKGKVIPEGGEYDSNGHTFRVTNGKPVVVK